MILFTFSGWESFRFFPGEKISGFGKISGFWKISGWESLEKFPGWKVLRVCGVGLWTISGWESFRVGNFPLDR
jgi:hypothetical protein